jgi:hypothetical protein
MGTPPYINVDLKLSGRHGKNRTFADNQKGAREAADWVTAQLGCDNWKLEPMEFLGYRIVVESSDGKGDKQA